MSTPAACPMRSASAATARCVATSRLFTSFATCPAPGPPTGMIFAAMRSSTGRARSIAAASPPSIIASVPAAAPAGPPETGASR
jgi:hypothetical protein